MLIKQEFAQDLTRFQVNMKYHIALTALFASKASATTALRNLAVSEQDPLEVCYPDDQWIDYKGTSYIFERQAYHTKCVDRQQRSFEYGAFMGIYTTGAPCATACVKGTTVSELKGCNASDRPPLSALVGYEYDCDLATCYCLYNHGTLSDKYSRCFDSMNTSGQGYIPSEPVSTATVKDRTCYDLHTQPAGPAKRVATQIPTATPIPPPGGICTRSPDYGCYKSGRPACCNSAYTCPTFMTLCDNAGAGTTGTSPCTWSPDYGCWPSTNGRPPCCSKDGGAFVNCPKTEDLKKYQPCEPTPSPTRNPTRHPTRKPTRKPTPKPQQQQKKSICTYSPNYNCYKSGRPACCNSAYKCPSFMTLCDNDNVGADMPGSNPCTRSPDYGCWPSTNGRPPCCSKDGGAFVNCPHDNLKKYQPCESQKSPGGICTRSPDYGCYKSGRPACCNSGYTCPSFMTMCDNAGANMAGNDYCASWGPDYGCWPSTHGRPPCCNKDGGSFVNCPKKEDLKKYQPCKSAAKVVTE